jgi:hypothetical protein
VKTMPKLRIGTAAMAALATVIVVALTTSSAQAVGRHRVSAVSQSGTSMPPPVATGTLTINGQFADGSIVRAEGLTWNPGSLPAGDRLLTFEVAYNWSSCTSASGGCRVAEDSTSTPFSARSYRVGHKDGGRFLRLTEVATEVVETNATTFAQGPHSTSSSVASSTEVTGYRSGRAPRTEFVNGTPEATTGSTSEYFSVDPPHYAATDGAPTMQYRIDTNSWLAMPTGDVFYTGNLVIGRHRVDVRTANSAGATDISFSWRVVPLPAPLPCVPRPDQACWYPPHLNSLGQPMRWDWQIGLVTPQEKTGASAVDLYDIDGFLTTASEVSTIHQTWTAATLPHPKAVCYLDVAWEEYRPDASPESYGGKFPASTLGKVYFGFPAERWLDVRQLDALEPMLKERINMCAQKGFDAVEIDDIDSFDPPSTTGFHLTPGDAENFLAYTFNLIHADGMTALWKNSPLLSAWGARYTDGAVVEECYVSQQCDASQFVGQGIDGTQCTALSGPTPCGWDDFTTDDTANQPNGKWVGEAEYVQDHYVCKPSAACRAPHRSTFLAYCQAVYAPPSGFSAVLFNVDLNDRVFLPCPDGR